MANIVAKNRSKNRSKNEKFHFRQQKNERQTYNFLPYHDENQDIKDKY